MEEKTLLEGISQEVPGTSQDFHDLGLQECSYVTRGDIPGSLRDILAGTSMTWDYRSVAVTKGDIPGSARDIPGYV